MSFISSSPSLLLLRHCPTTTSSHVKSLRVRTISYTRSTRFIDLNNKYKAYPSDYSLISVRSTSQQPQQVWYSNTRSNSIQNHCCKNVVRNSSSGNSTTSNTDDNRYNNAMTNNNNNNNKNQTPTNTTTTSTDGVVGIPIDFDIAATIEGNESQIVIIQLRKGEVLRAESGAMMYMTDGIQMNTTTGGNISTGFSRMLTGQNFFISDYTYNGNTNNDEYGTVALGTDFPSKIIRLNVSDYTKLICQKGALLCASHTIDIQMEFTKNFTTGFFGGEGFILQGLTGNGEVFLKAGGTIIKRELQDKEQLRISSGCLVAFTSGVDYDVQLVKGFTNVIAGGEGLFMTTLIGPGIVWLQGQPPQRMINEIARRVPSGGGGIILPVGVGGGGGSGGGGTGTTSSSGGGTSSIE